MEKNLLGTPRISQIAILVRDIEASSERYATLFGVEKPKWFLTSKEERAQFRGEPTQAQAKLAFFEMENITLELIEPVGAPSTWQEALDAKGECVHHIAFNVNGMDTIIHNLEQVSIPLIQRGGDPSNGGGYAYCDGEKQLGLVIELLEGY